jgi:hypothetical protein
MRSVILRSLAVACLALLSVGCLYRGPQPFAVQDLQSTLAGVLLRDGDVVVNQAPNPTSMILSRHSPTPGRFSHAGVFVHAADGTPMVYHLRDGGGRAMKASDYFRRNELTGVYRHRRPDAPDRLGPHIRQWLAENDIAALPFVLFPDPDDFNSPPYNCNTFVNSLYLGAGIDPPFVQPESASSSGWTREISRFVASDWTRITSASAVVGNPQFQEVVVWRNPAIDPRLTAAMEGFTDAIRAEVESGRRLKTQARHPPARLLAACFGDDDSEYATTQVVAIHFNLKDSWSRVRSRIMQVMRRDGDRFQEEHAYELGRKLALEHLDGFFE